MMNKCLAVFLVPVLAGCLSAHVPSVSEWTVVAESVRERSDRPPAFGVTRLAQVTVCAPYDDRQMVVYRSDNTLASDAYNHFMSIPSRLLKEPALRVLNASGKFKTVVRATSSANVSHVVELSVTDFRLDCARDEAHPDRCDAVAEVYVQVLDANRDIAGSARGTARVDARDGNYGAAFSKAFSEALSDSLLEF